MIIPSSASCNIVTPNIIGNDDERYLNLLPGGRWRGTGTRGPGWREMTGKKGRKC